MVCQACGQRGGRSRHAVCVSAGKVVVRFVHGGSVERVEIHVKIFGRRAVIVRLTTPRAPKALPASSIALRPRCARLAALTARIAIRFWQLSTAATQTCLTTVSDGATV